MRSSASGMRSSLLSARFPHSSGMRDEAGRVEWMEKERVPAAHLAPPPLFASPCVALAPRFAWTLGTAAKVGSAETGPESRGSTASHVTGTREMDSSTFFFFLLLSLSRLLISSHPPPTPPVLWSVPAQSELRAPPCRKDLTPQRAGRSLKSRY